MEGLEWIEKIPKFIRWILWLPVPYLASRVILWLAKFCTGWFYPDITSNPNAIWWALYDAVLTPFILGYGGYIIAPKFKYGFGIVQPIVFLGYISFIYVLAIAALISLNSISILGTWEGIRAIAIWLATIVFTVVACVVLYKQSIEDREKIAAQTLLTGGGAPHA